MFTGIVERKASVVDVRLGVGGGERLVLEVHRGKGLPPWQAAQLGESICVSGVCLTVVESSETLIGFDVVPETLRLTTLGGLKRGSEANLERSLAVGERFGGHFVTGHIDGAGKVVERRPEGDQILFRIETSTKLLGEMIPKGSITVDGVSLTVVDICRPEKWFSFVAIPHTLELTTLGERYPPQKVNLETDAFGKWILHGLKERMENG